MKQLQISDTLSVTPSLLGCALVDHPHNSSQFSEPFNSDTLVSHHSSTAVDDYNDDAGDHYHHQHFTVDGLVISSVAESE